MENIEGNISVIELEPWELVDHIGETIQIHGSIYKIRKMKGFAFVLLRTKRVILSILVYTFFSRMFDLMQPLVVKYSIAVA